MIKTLLDILAPDYCYSCGKIGTIMCDSCVYNIIEEPFGRCVECLTVTVGDNLCSNCPTPVKDAWVVGERTGVLEKLVNESKFSANRRACRGQAVLLSRVIPRLSEPTVIVPIPTIGAHIRQRGFGHAEYIAQALANIRHLSYRPSLLYRATSTVQYGTSRAKRLAQAKKAFRCNAELDPHQPILLVDDVYTTGASIRAAAEVMLSSGASEVSAAITTRQLLDE